MNEFKNEIMKNYTMHEQELLKYFFLCMLYEVGKFVILFIFFSMFQMQTVFCIEVIILMTIRNFFGGLHFKHNISCFLFTLAFMVAGMILNESINPNFFYKIGILVICCIVSIMIKPIMSCNHPKASKKAETIYHRLGILQMFIYLMLFITMKTFPYSNLCFWVIVLQTLQLLVAEYNRKEAKKYEM